MNKIDVAGLKVDSITKQGLLKYITDRVQSGEKTFVTTPYSEFLYRGLLDPKIIEILNRSDFAVPDGIGVFWARKFLDIPLTAKSYYGKILQAFWQVKYTLASIIFYPKFIKSAFAEKISGSDLIWDLLKLAFKNNQSIYLLGGFNDTPQIVAKKISSLFRGREKGMIVQKEIVAGFSNKEPQDPTIIEDIKKSGADFLFVALGPIKQEQWIVDHINELPCKLYIGLGGTFDYIAGKRPSPPSIIRSIGLEWLWRLVTQPHRAKRIWQATFGLITALIRYKVFSSLSFRENVVSIVLNYKNEVLIAKREKYASWFRTIGENNEDKFSNYWQFSQGGVDEGENFQQTATRELKEELGIEKVEYIKTSEKIYSYNWNNGVRPLLGNYFKFKGQRQHIVYFKFLGNDSEIKPDQEEFTEYQWAPLISLDRLVHEERRQLAKIVQEDLRYLA